MTKTYLGYGYTNNRGVARLQYAPNGEELTHSGYKNNNDYDTDVIAKFTNKTKEYESNKKHYPTTTPHIEYIFCDDQSTDKRDYYEFRGLSSPNSTMDWYSVSRVYAVYVDSSDPLEQGLLQCKEGVQINDTDEWIVELEFKRKSFASDEGWIIDISYPYNNISTVHEFRWYPQYLRVTGGDRTIDEDIVRHYDEWYRLVFHIIRNESMETSLYDMNEECIHNSTLPLKEGASGKAFLQYVARIDNGMIRNVKIGKVVK